MRFSPSLLWSLSTGRRKVDPRTELFGNIIVGDRHELAVLARVAAPRGWLRGPHVQYFAGQNNSRCVRCRSSQRGR